MPIYHDGKKMKPYRGYRKPVNVYYGDKKVAGWKNSTQTGNNLTFQTTYNDTADVIVKGKSLQKSEWVHKQGLTTQSGTPTPEAPIPLVSNLPAGTYKVADYKGDWYEFTLTEDLHGIDDVRDSVEWDKYSHKGFLRDSIGIYAFTGAESDVAYYATFKTMYRAFPDASSIDSPMYCTHFKYTTNESTAPGYCFWGGQFPTSNKNLQLAGDFTDSASGKSFFAAQHASGTPVTVVYQLDTPTRTPLTFTKNNDSTAPECPMEFLTDTPSGEYPATVWDASGTVKARGKNLFDKSKAVDGYVIADLDGRITPNSDGFLTDYIRCNGGENLTSNRVGFPPRWNFYDINFVRISTLIGYSVKTPSGARYFVTYSTTATTDKDSLQIELGSTATSYEPYRPEVTAPIPVLRSNQDGTVYDEFEVKTGKLTRKIGRIESYNGEDVGDDWISSTGALDTGATVEYVLAEPIEEQYTPVTLPTYYPTTVITTTNDTPAELTTTATVKVEDV